MAVELSLGSMVPNFRLQGDDGQEISTAELKGKPYVLYFYPKDDTSGCTKEAIAFSERKREFDELGVRIVGISKDSVTSHRKFKDKYNLELTLASDPDTVAAKAFGVWVQKSMYGRRYMGMERSTFLIDKNGKIRQIWRKVSVTGHSDDVFKAARNL